MLQIQNICKKYQTGKLIQRALDDVSLNLRDNEFVAILGPSGSGKTTLLNMIGGLDRYDSGDLIINGISTKKYSDRDWDSYRNHTIGFVFQSYNLIPHQTILANVELALTISGVGKARRRQMAREALEKVGLGTQIEKKPNQLSGGQMQRVAIARALVNNPDILLADEPTGALDSETSVQVMDLLKEVAKDRLVVMVTHNPELAEEYANRIVRLKDGKIISDTNEYVVDNGDAGAPIHKNLGKASMSFLTSLSLSFNNLKTKKARTLLTSFAGSIGIIGIALILALSTGVNAYIQSVEEETLSEYPLQIQQTGFDITSMMVTASDNASQTSKEDSQEINIMSMVTNMFSQMSSNDLKSLKKYLESDESGIDEYVNAIEYSYGISPQIYRQNGDGYRQVNPDTSFSALGIGSGMSSNSIMSSMFSTDVFREMPENENMYKNQYDVKAGRWPTSYNECVVILTSSGGISDFLLYILGLRDTVELDKMVEQFTNGEDVEVPENIGTYTYQNVLNIKFKLVNAADYYEYDQEYETWKDKSDNKKYMRQLVAEGEDLTVVGVIQPKEDSNGILLNTGIGYLPELITHVSDEAAKSDIVKQQLADDKTDVFTGEKFGSDEAADDFDLSSLFSIDEDAMKDMFQFDMGDMSDLAGSDMGAMTDSLDLSDSFQMDGDSMDLSGLLDMDDMNLELPDMQDINFGDLMQNIEINATPEQLQILASSLLQGYENYSGQSIETDFWNLTTYIETYLSTPEAEEIILRYMLEILQETDAVTIDTGNLQSLFAELMTGYQSYLVVNGYTDPDKMNDYLEEYLQTPEAAQILENGIPSLIRIQEDLDIPIEKLQGLAAELTSGYQEYAAENNLPDPRRMGQHFLEYLGSEEAQSMLTDGVMEMMDVDNLSTQISQALQEYMGQAFTTFGTAIAEAIQSQITAAMTRMSDQIAAAITDMMTQMIGNLQEQLEDAFAIDEDAFADAFAFDMDGEELMELMMSMMSFESASYTGNLQKLGYADFEDPTGIDIYPKDFESKAEVVRVLDEYNERMEAEGKEDQVITYTDMVGTLMSSVTDIIDIISYVLIAFVAISLVVSSIMIGVITYLSVLERKKEIGILRAIGASKNNISQVFNAETGLIGFCAGLIGIGLTFLLLIPGNALIHHFAGNNEVNAVLHPLPAIILILLSIVLTLIGGLIPSRKAAKSDPVTALRTD